MKPHDVCAACFSLSHWYPVTDIQWLTDWVTDIQDSQFYKDSSFFLLVTLWGLLDSQVPDRRRQWHPTPVILPGKSHGWESLVGWNPWGRYESDMTSLSLFTSMHWRRKWQPTPASSCLENPRDRGARWAAVYGVTQSRTRLIGWTTITIEFKQFL